MVFGSIPVDLFGWGDGKGGDLPFAQDPSHSGQFAQQWKLRMMAQGASLKGVAISKLRRLPAYNEPFGRTDVRIGDAALFCKAMDRESAPRSRRLWAWLESRGNQVSVSNLSGSALLRAEGGGGEGRGGGGMSSLAGPNENHGTCSAGD